MIALDENSANYQQIIQSEPPDDMTTHGNFTIFLSSIPFYFRSTRKVFLFELNPPKVFMAGKVTNSFDSERYFVIAQEVSFEMIISDV